MLTLSQSLWFKDETANFYMPTEMVNEQKADAYSVKNKMKVNLFSITSILIIFMEYFHNLSALYLIYS